MPLIHYCFSQHLNESLPGRKCTGDCSKNKKRCDCKRCKCRQQVSAAEAHQLVQSGQAEYVVTKKEPISIKKICPICVNDERLKKSCSSCNKTGEVIYVVMSPAYSTDIVAVTISNKDSEHEVFRSVMAKQTPRVATIELPHIFRAYINGYVEEQERINIYGEMNKEFLQSLIIPFQPDPNEGRCLFSFGPDDRTSPKSTRS